MRPQTRPVYHKISLRYRDTDVYAYNKQNTDVTKIN